MTPTISVILPVYNEKPHILHQSLQSILEQDFHDFELLLLDDGSTDKECLAVIEEFSRRDPRIIVMRQERNMGITKILNLGIEAARGVYIARMDSDDIATKERFSRQLEYLQKNPEIALCGSWVKMIDEKGVVIGQRIMCIRQKDIYRHILSYNPFVHSTLFFRKKVIQMADGYNESMKRAQDYDLVLRLVAQKNLAILPEFLLFYRVNEKSITFQNNKEQEKYALRARFLALKRRDFPLWYSVFLIRPLLFYLFIPLAVKKYLMRLLWKI